jgi:hypothetical protein
MDTMIRLFAPLGLALFQSTAVLGCPFCSSEVGLEVRATLFGADFMRNVAAISLPFLMLTALVAWLFYDSSTRLESVVGENHDE